MALPNKFFDYVQARLGVIIGPSPEMRPLLEAYGFGATASGFDVGAITRVLDALTPEQILEWKLSADQSARALSAEPQIQVWEAAVEALMERTPA